MAFSLEQAKSWKRLKDSLAYSEKQLHNYKLIIERDRDNLEKLENQILKEHVISLIYVIDDSIITVENNTVVERYITAKDTTRPKSVEVSE